MAGRVTQILSNISGTFQDHHWLPQSFVTQGTKWYHPIASVLNKMGIDLTNISLNISNIPYEGSHLNQYMRFIQNDLNKLLNAYNAAGQSWNTAEMEVKLQSIILRVMEAISNSSIKAKYHS